MKKILTSVLVLLFGVGTFAFADYPDSFQVEVNPSGFEVNQPVDLTIKAIKNGQIMKNYEGRLFIEIEGGNISPYDYTVPEDGWWEMKLTNQGEKTYSKGLQLKKAWTFSVKVSDFIMDNVIGTTTIIVSSDDVTDTKDIQLLSPLQNGKETQSVMSVMANAPELVNSRIQIYLNDLMVKEGKTDAGGILNESVPLTKTGTNVLELKAVSISNQVVGLSEKRTFLYEPSSEDLFKSIAMTPNQDLKIWDKVRFEIFTDPLVSSAKLMFSGGQESPLDKEKDGLFVKEIMLTTSGEQVLNTQLSAGITNKTYNDILTFSVRDNIKIAEVKISLNSQMAGTLDFAWNTIGGESNDYAIKYGFSNDNLAGITFTTEPKASLSWFSYGKTYFFQILATTPEHIPDGLPSEVIQFDLPILGGTGLISQPLSGSALTTDEPHGAAVIHDAPTCVVKNIQFSTKKIGNKYYLVWNKVNNVKKYLIYRSDFSDWSDKKFVWETDLPRFEYPFDKTSEEDIYAYYSVEAICSDGERLILTEAEKVKVWPLEDIMLILSCTFLLYLMYRLYSYRI